jgi:hypothetical protein
VPSDDAPWPSASCAGFRISRVRVPAASGRQVDHLAELQDRVVAAGDAPVALTRAAIRVE